MNATNNQTKLESKIVKKVLERFINESLADSKAARITNILACSAPIGEQGEPNCELQVTFAVADRWG